MESQAVIVAGFGFSTRATVESLRDALARACAEAQVECPQVLATAEDKVTALTVLAQELGLPIHAIPVEKLAGQVTQTRSVRVTAERGTGSVAEAAALAGAGPGARFLVDRRHAQDRLASCALAQGTLP